MNLINTNRVIKNIILALIILLFFNCSIKDKATEWDQVKIFSEISKESTYTELDKQKEIFSVLEIQDLLMKKTSDVSYYYGELKKDDYYAKFNNCRATIFKSDTVSINIGISNGFTGDGFIIEYCNKKFHTQPYHSDDTVFEGEVEPTYKLIYQKLTLDKSNYKIGDSIYGKIQFESIETTGFYRGREHNAVGYFRAKVQKPEWDISYER